MNIIDEIVFMMLAVKTLPHSKFKKLMENIYVY